MGGFGLLSFCLYENKLKIPVDSFLREPYHPHIESKHTNGDTKMTTLTLESVFEECGTGFVKTILTEGGKSLAVSVDIRTNEVSYLLHGPRYAFTQEFTTMTKAISAWNEPE